MIEKYKENLKGRYPTTKIVFSLLEERKVKNIVETGTIRKYNNWSGDGYSTLIFGEYCKNVEGQLWTCDIDPEAIKISKDITNEYSDYIHYIIDDSIKFLTNFKEKIDLLYLDSFNSTKGMEEQASEHNKKELLAAMNKLHQDSIIFIDDYHHASKKGKGMYSVPFLLNNGWKLVSDVKNYQAVLIRK